MPPKGYQFGPSNTPSEYSNITANENVQMSSGLELRHAGQSISA